MTPNHRAHLFAVAIVIVATLMMPTALAEPTDKGSMPSDEEVLQFLLNSNGSLFPDFTDEDRCRFLNSGELDQERVEDIFAVMEKLRYMHLLSKEETELILLSESAKEALEQKKTHEEACAQKSKAKVPFCPALLVFSVKSKKTHTTYWISALYGLMKKQKAFAVYNSAGLLEDLYYEIKEKLQHFDGDAKIAFMKQTRIPMQKNYGGNVLPALWNVFAPLVKGVPTYFVAKEKFGEVDIVDSALLDSYISVAGKEAIYRQLMEAIIGECPTSPLPDDDAATLVSKLSQTEASIYFDYETLYGSWSRGLFVTLATKLGFKDAQHKDVPLPNQHLKLIYNGDKKRVLSVGDRIKYSVEGDTVLDLDIQRFGIQMLWKVYLASRSLPQRPLKNPQMVLRALQKNLAKKNKNHEAVIAKLKSDWNVTTKAFPLGCFSTDTSAGSLVVFGTKNHDSTVVEFKKLDPAGVYAEEGSVDVARFESMASLTLRQCHPRFANCFFYNDDIPEMEHSPLSFTPLEPHGQEDIEDTSRGYIVWTDEGGFLFYHTLPKFTPKGFFGIDNGNVHTLMERVSPLYMHNLVCMPLKEPGEGNKLRSAISRSGVDLYHVGQVSPAPLPDVGTDAQILHMEL